MQPITIPPSPLSKEEKLERIGVNAEKAADMLDVSIGTIWNLTKEGRLPHVRLGRRIIFSVAGLRRFVEGKEKPGDHDDQPGN